MHLRVTPLEMWQPYDYPNAHKAILKNMDKCFNKSANDVQPETTSKRNMHAYHMGSDVHDLPLYHCLYLLSRQRATLETTCLWLHTGNHVSWYTICNLGNQVPATKVRAIRYWLNTPGINYHFGLEAGIFRESLANTMVAHVLAPNFTRSSAGIAMVM